MIAWLRTFGCICLAGAGRFFAIVAVAMAIAASGGGARADDMTAKELATLLKAGGLIMYVRHAATDHSQSDVDVTDLGNCAMQRNLSEQGKEESRRMAAAIAELGIPVGEVYSSPYCRTVDTARLVFGRYTIEDGLTATFYTDAAETARIGTALRRMLSTVPEGAVNTVLVGHTANLSDVTKVWPKPEGVVHVFRPLGAGGFRHLGRIEPMDWTRLRSGQ